MRQSTDPTVVRVRHVRLDASGTVTVLGQKLAGDWEGLNGRGGFASGTVERRLYEEGQGTLRLPNSEGFDGQRHLDRLAVFSDAAFAPGDEWFEVWQDTDLLAVWTPTGSQRATRGDIQLSGEDATTLLKRTRETQNGYWCHAPRDVIEHYGRVWRTIAADSFQTNAFTYSGSAQNTADGVWAYTRCESDQANRPGTVRLRAAAGETATLKTRPANVPVKIGATATDQLAPWRLEITFSRSVLNPGDSLAVGLVGPVVPDSLYGFTITGTSTLSQVGSTGLDAKVDTQPPGPFRLAIEGRERFFFFELDGRVVGVLPKNYGSDTADTVGLTLTSTTGSITVDVASLTFRQADRLLVADGDGDLRLPGSPSPGGLYGEYFDLRGDNAAFPGLWGWVAHRPGRDVAASRVETVNFATANPPAWQPPAVGPDYFAARWSGAIRLDLDASDVALRVNGDDDIRLWVGRTRFVDEWAAAAVGVPSPTTALWLKAGSVVTAAPSGATGPLAGQQTGWYPIRVEYVQGFGAGGAVLEYMLSSAPGTWTPVPPAWLSPYGCYTGQVRHDSHYDALKAVADAFGYQWTCEPRSLESGRFPGAIAPRVRLGRDTEKTLDEPDAVDIQAEIDLDSRADIMVADAAGIADPDGAAQLSASMASIGALGEHLAEPVGYESLAEISQQALLEQRLSTLLALGSSPWQTVAARDSGGGRALLDSWPLTGTLAKFAWLPGDGIRLNLPSVGVVDATPRQILGLTQQIAPNSVQPPTAAFRPRPKSLTGALRELRRTALTPRRHYQRQLATVTGSIGVAAPYVGGADGYSRISLPVDGLVRCELVVLAKADASAWTIEVNTAATPIIITQYGRYDVTAWTRAVPGGYNFAQLITGGTGTGAWTIRLEATVRI